VAIFLTTALQILKGLINHQEQSSVESPVLQGANRWEPAQVPLDTVLNWGLENPRNPLVGKPTPPSADIAFCGFEQLFRCQMLSRQTFQPRVVARCPPFLTTSQTPRTMRQSSRIKLG
jgi:hypothetical protein